MKLAATENDLARVEGLLSTERNALGETERYYAEQKGLMTDDEVQVAGAKHKLAQAKNSKEYMAAQREIEQRREALTSREGEITKLVEAVDAKKKLLSDRASDVEALKDVDLEGPRRRQGAHGRDPGEDRRAARRARQAGGRGEAGRAQALQQHPDAPRPGGRQRPQRHLPGLQHEHPAAALQHASARPDGRDLPLLPPHHLLGGDHEGRPGLRLDSTTPSTASRAARTHARRDRVGWTSTASCRPTAAVRDEVSRLQRRVSPGPVSSA